MADAHVLYVSRRRTMPIEFVGTGWPEKLIGCGEWFGVEAQAAACFGRPRFMLFEGEERCKDETVGRSEPTRGSGDDIVCIGL